MTATACSLSKAAIDFQSGTQALSRRDVHNALEHFENAELAGYDINACAGGRWYCRMLLCDFELAWQESDAIASRAAVDPFRLWDGTGFQGKHVIIRCLHGFGDAIQFIRYARLMRRETASITVETHPELLSLFSLVPYVDRVVTWADGSSKRFTEWNQQIEVMELPWAFRTTVATIPAEVPYLFVNPAAKQRTSSRLKVGIVWRSSNWNPARSIPVSRVAALLDVPGISFFSFQHEPTTAELAELRQYTYLRDISELSPQISDTAANMMQMDLLITVDGMSAHLAGALGKQVWTMLPYEADWRWMLNAAVTPWYPTMTLFRQSNPGDWDSVLTDVAARLRSYNTTRW